MKNKISNIITLLVFLFIIYTVVNNTELINFNNLNKKVSEVYKEKSVLKEFQIPKIQFSEQNNNKSKDNFEKQKNNIEEKKEVAEGIEDKFKVKSEKTEAEREKKEKIVEKSEKTENKICTVKKSQCNTCIKIEGEDKFACTKVFCQNEEFKCIQY